MLPLLMDRFRRSYWQWRERGTGSWLNEFEDRSSSQNGEDGMLLALFQRIGTTNQRFVEIGAANGVENCTRFLLEEEDWTGWWVEGWPGFVADAKDRFGHLSVEVIEAVVNTSNVQTVFETLKIPAEIDLLVIDIDGNDAWVWEALGRRARVVVIEYNGSLPLGMRWLQPNNVNRYWNGTRSYGSSLLTLVLLADYLGYTLIACDSGGVNAFFVLSDIVDEYWDTAPESYRQLYRSPKHESKYFGHPRRVPDDDIVRAPIALLEQLGVGPSKEPLSPTSEGSEVMDVGGERIVDDGYPQPNSTQPIGLCARTVVQVTRSRSDAYIVEYTVTNIGTAHWLGSRTGQAGETNLGVQALDAGGEVLDPNYSRIELAAWPLSVAPGQSVNGTTTIYLPPEGTEAFRFVPVAEMVAWFHEVGSQAIDLPLPSAITKRSPKWWTTKFHA